MGESIEILIDGRCQRVREGASLAVALLELAVPAFRYSVSGEPRGPLCGMGTCFECRVTVGGRPHQRACLIPCIRGMVVETGTR
jgi:hypothetical protein